MAAILLIDDERSLRQTVREVLQAAGYFVTEAADGEEALEALSARRFDVALCDWRMPRMGGHDFLLHLAAGGLRDDLPVLVLTAFGDADSAAEAMQAGAYDFLVKPIDLDLILAKVGAALEHSKLQQELRSLETRRFQASPAWTGKREPEEPQLIGRSSLWIELFKKIGQVARTGVSVLIQGETGTGKEVVARAIHQRSDRSEKPLVIVNCAAIPAELVESELFGHERGAFTGAAAQRIGRFEAAEGGTIFLDEIGELPLTLQPKLLRALQERTIQRVGSNRTLHVDVRVIAATNVDLQHEVQEKRFRADLFYRLNAYALRLPSLRDRRSDIPLLTGYFLDRFARRNGTPACAMPEAAQELLNAYDFPGNVRELEQLVDRLAVGAGGRAIPVESVRAALHRESTGATLSPAEDFEAWAELPFHESVARWERHLIERAMEAANGNKSDAARRLGIQRRLLYEKLERLDGSR